MRKLLGGTTAYSVLRRDAASGRAAHAYLLYFQDGAYLRFALKYFALALFGTDETRREGSLIMSESFADAKVFPAEGKKPAVSDADEIAADSALNPLEGDKKLYVFTDFDQASAVVQNKLLKLLEEPPQGVYFLLGATSLSPVLQTVLSRVRVLELPPFSRGDVLAALGRAGAEGRLAEAAAASAGGLFGQAERMAFGGWFNDILSAAERVSRASSAGEAGALSAELAEVREKAELLRQVQRIYFDELKECVSSGDMSGHTHTRPALIHAVEAVNGALEDLKFNANFSSLLFGLMTDIITENDKWKKLLA